MRVIGLCMPRWRDCDAVRDCLIANGWLPEAVLIVSSDALARQIRYGGGLVVHLETCRRPSFAGHITSAGLECHVGDLVVGGLLDIASVGRAVAQIQEEAASDG